MCFDETIIILSWDIDRVIGLIDFKLGNCEVTELGKMNQKGDYYLNSERLQLRTHLEQLYTAIQEIQYTCSNIGRFVG